MPKRYRPEIRRKVPDLLKAGLTQRPFRNGPIRLREARLKAVGHFVVFELAIESWCCDTRSPSIKDQDRSRTDRARIARGIPPGASRPGYTPGWLALSGWTLGDTS
jgi:hypothetical protein